MNKLIQDVPKDCIEFRGDCFGVRVYDKKVERASNRLCQFMVEDDENWFLQDVTFDSFWIDDIIKQLERAKEAIGG